MAESACSGGSRGFSGDFGDLRNLTTNQKAAGSSPAERTTKYLQIRCFCPSDPTRMSARTTRLTTYLFRNCLVGRHSGNRISLDPHARNVARVCIR
jgi:hypothetical protein